MIAWRGVMKGARTYTVPIFGATVHVANRRDTWDRMYAALLAKSGGVDASPEAGMKSPAGLTWAVEIDDTLHVLVGTFIRGAAIATHEAVHVAQFIATHIGMDPLREVEAFAHLTEWAFNSIRGRL